MKNKNDAGEKVDNTTEDAEITNSTSVMMTTVAGNKGAIGYVSLGSLNDTVKAVAIDGAEATVDAIKAGDLQGRTTIQHCSQGWFSDVLRISSSSS